MSSQMNNYLNQFDLNFKRVVGNLNSIIKKTENQTDPAIKGKYYVEFCSLLSFTFKNDFKLYSRVVYKLINNHKFLIPEVLFFIKTIDSKVFLKNYEKSDSLTQQKIDESLNLIKDSHLVSQTAKLEVGRLDYESALIIAASTKERKKYDFNPIIFKDDLEFDKFIDYIKDNFEQFENKEINFLRTGVHWMSGKIKLEKSSEQQKSAKLLIIDSLGDVSRNQSITFGSGLFEKVKNTFPKSEIYFTDQQIQNSGAGCSIFSLYSLIKLYSIQHRLLGDENIFSYLKSKVDSKILKFKLQNKDIVEIFPARLPLSLLQLWQSNKLKDEEELKILGYTEQELQDKNLTKKHKPFIEVVVPYFIESRKKAQNKRMEQVLLKIKEYVMYYCMLTQEQNLQQKMKKFTLNFWLEQQEEYKGKESKYGRQSINSSLEESVPDDIEKLFEEYLYTGNFSLTKKVQSELGKAISYPENCHDLFQISENATSINTAKIKRLEKELHEVTDRKDYVMMEQQQSLQNEFSRQKNILSIIRLNNGSAFRNPWQRSNKR